MGLILGRRAGDANCIDASRSAAPRRADLRSDRLCVGPFAQGGLDEAFGFAVGFGRVGLGADVLDPKSRQARGKAKAL